MTHNHDPTQEKNFILGTVTVAALSTWIFISYLTSELEKQAIEKEAVCTPIETQVLADYAQSPLETKQLIENEGHKFKQSIRANFWLNTNGKFGLYPLQVPSTEHYDETISLNEFNNLLSQDNRGLSVTTDFAITTTNDNTENPKKIICEFSDKKQLHITTEPT